MVAINKFSLTLILACAGCISAYSQQVKPRIDGLETNSQYMTLLTEDSVLTQREDSIALVVGSLRDSFRVDSSDSNQSRDKIISLENQLFELRARKAMVVDSLNVIEQEWVLNNMNGVFPESTSDDSVAIESEPGLKHIYESSHIQDNLSGSDYKNLVKAGKLEREVDELSRLYIVNHNNLLSLSRSYEVTPQQSEAEMIEREFDSLYNINSDIIKRLDDSWAYIYDNKSFAYSMVMELLGFSDVLDQEAELMRNAQAEITEKHGSGRANALLRYQVQKNSMVNFERLVAQKLGLSSVVDSLAGVSSKLSKSERRLLPDVSIKERLFILYEPVEFVTKQIYNSSNPIPETVIYDKGVIFRLYVGSFQYKQSAGIFRNTTPLSWRVNEDDRYCYYIGGYETLEEAEEAQALLKKRGFRAPQVVVWSDGRERNLTDDPLPISTSYRIEILGSERLPEGVSGIAPEGSISKVGGDKFVIMPLERESQADSLMLKIKELDQSLDVVVEKNELKIEF